MINPKYRYPAEKLCMARRNLMAPHPTGEAASYESAFLECDLGLKGVLHDDLDDNARSWRRTIDETMSTRGIEDNSGKGTWAIKVARLTRDQRQQFSSAVDELASWFHSRFQGC